MAEQDWLQKSEPQLKGKDQKYLSNTVYVLDEWRILDFTVTPTSTI